MINNILACSPQPRKPTQKEAEDCSRQSSVLANPELLKMNAQLQAGKVAVKSFAKEVLQSCRGCHVTVFAANLHGKSGLWMYHIERGCSKHQCCAPYACDHVCRNPATAGDTSQLCLPCRLSWCEGGFRTEIWPTLAVEAHYNSPVQNLTQAF